MDFNLKTTLKWDGDIVILIGKKVVNKSVLETGLIVEGDAKLLCPVDKGELAASIDTREEKPGIVFVGTSLYYAPYVFLGTINQDAQPTLRPALLKAKGANLVILNKNGKSLFGGYLE